MKTGLTKFGQWQKANRMIDNLERDIEFASKQYLMQVGIKGRDTAVEHIQKQDLNWKPLTSRYKAYKEKKKLSNKILISDSTYWQNITTFTEKDKAYIGVKRDVKDKDGNQIANIAKVLEYGSVSRNIPARPLWSPVMMEMKKWIRENKFVLFLAKYINKKYGI